MHKVGDKDGDMTELRGRRVAPFKVFRIEGGYRKGKVPTQWRLIRVLEVMLLVVIYSIFNGSQT